MERKARINKLRQLIHGDCEYITVRRGRIDHLGKYLGFRVEPEEIKPWTLISEQLKDIAIEDYKYILQEMRKIRKLILPVWFDLPSTKKDLVIDLAESLGNYEVGVLRLIRSIEIEKPGFIKNFPEYREFLEFNGDGFNGEYLTVHEYIWKHYSIKPGDYDRYQEKRITKELKDWTKEFAKSVGLEWLTWRIKDKKTGIEYKDLEIDNFLAGWAEEIITSGREELKNIIKSSYLNPISAGNVAENYLDVLNEIEHAVKKYSWKNDDNSEVPWEKELKNHPEYVLDLYFKYLDWIKEHTLHGETRKYKPSTIKFILTTVISG